MNWIRGLCLLSLLVVSPAWAADVVKTILGTGLVVAGDATPTSAVVLPAGSKSIYGSVTGTGAVTQTQKIYSGLVSTFTPTVDGVLLCTLTLSGTTTAVDQCPVITAAGMFYKVVTSATTGTGATGVVTSQHSF